MRRASRSVKKRATGGGRDNPDLDDIGARLPNKSRKKKKKKGRGGAYVLTFGKFKGRQLHLVPEKYLNWLNENLGDDFREALAEVRRLLKKKKDKRAKAVKKMLAEDGLDELDREYREIIG